MENVVVEAVTEKQVTAAKQYSLVQILALWAVITLPMALTRFWIVPQYQDQVSIHPGLFFWWLIIAGMAWQFVVSMIVLKIELKSLSWTRLKARLWLNHPIDPDTKRVNKRIYWLTIPMLLVILFMEGSGIFDFLTDWFVGMFPFMAQPEFARIENLAVPEFRGAWYLIGIVLVSSLFNYLLGEELFFRGLLLPKMEGVFGRWAWVANGVLFGAYHVHKLEVVPIFIFSSGFYSLLNQRYRSFYPGLIIHGVEFLPLIILITLFVAGF